MNPTRTLTSLAILASLSSLLAEPVSLFNGKDIAGWSTVFEKKDESAQDPFSVKDGIIVCAGKPKGFIKTDKSYSSYTLSYEWRFARPDGLEKESDFKGNSGCLVHISEGKGISLWPRSLEVQGMNRQAGLMMFIPRNVKGELSYDKKAYAKAIKPVGEWNTFEIVVDGGNLTASLNGVKLSECKDSELTEGPIGLQSEGAEIHFRNLQLTEKQKG